MINKLRKKFIFITIVSVSLVLLIIMGIVNITNFVKIKRKADYMLEIIANNNGAVPKPDKHNKNKLSGYMSPETPYETRYFTVTVKNDGNIMFVDTGYVAAISTSDAVEYAEDVLKKGRKSGICENYRYLVKKGESSSQIIFLDFSRDLETFKYFLITSIFASSVGIFSVFILVVIFSKIAIKPVSQSYEKQKQFITNASHEIKTPLTIISASAEVIEMENGESQWVDSIKNQITRLTELTKSLISLARMDENDINITFTDFSLSDCMAETLEPFISLAKSKNRTILADIEKNISYTGNEDAIRQLTAILADNAVKYSEENSDITISLKKHGKNNEIVVSNKAENLQKGDYSIYFERFYRADLSHNSTQSGYGIGLSIAKAIAEQHHGKISAKSLDGNTIIFTVIL